MSYSNDVVYIDAIDIYIISKKKKREKKLMYISVSMALTQIEFSFNISFFFFRGADFQFSPFSQSKLISFIYILYVKLGLCLTICDFFFAGVCVCNAATITLVYFLPRSGAVWWMAIILLTALYVLCIVNASSSIKCDKFIRLMSWILFCFSLHSI